MGKNITRRKKNGKRITKNNRRKKVKGGDIVRAGEELTFNPKSVIKKIRWTKVDMIDKFKKKFCDALHVKLLNADDSDSENGFYFFYNYIYSNLRDAVGNTRRLLNRTFAYGTPILRNLARAPWALSDSETSETAWIQNLTSKFVEKIAHSLSFPSVEFKEEDRKDWRGATYEIFKNGWTGSLYTAKVRGMPLVKSRYFENNYNGLVIAYKNNQIIYRTDNFYYNHYLIPFAKIESFIKDFDFMSRLGDKSTYNVSFLTGDEATATIKEVKESLDKVFEDKKYQTHQPVQDAKINYIKYTEFPKDHTGKQIWNAIVNKNVEKLNQLATSADTQGVAINYTDPDGRPPIYFAVKYDDLMILKELLKHKCFDVNQQNNRGDTPLHLAIYYRDIEKLKLLVEKPEIIIDNKAFSLNEEFNNEHPEFDEINEILTNKIITSSPAPTHTQSQHYTPDDL